MKKAARISVYSLLLLTVIFFSLPYAVKLEPVQAELKERLNSRFGVRADIAKVTWQWLPSPRVSLYKVGLSHQRLNISSSYGAVCPDIVGLIRRRPAVRLILEQPEIIVKSLRDDAGRKEKSGVDRKPSLPFVSLYIKNGHLLLPSDGFLKKLATQAPHLEIFEIDAEIAPSHDGFNVKSFFRPFFADRIASHVSLKKQRHRETGELKNYWRLDISGENIDLTAAREKVLLLFGEHNVARKICDIVRGGRAKTGRYIFQGYNRDFKNPDAMIISAFADNVDIHVPKIKLPLEQCSGPILIKDSALTGEFLSARLGNSIGRNGSIILNVFGRRDSAFRFAADLDADLKELRGWLINNLLFSQKPIVNELQKISNVQGRAKGRLHIGDSLGHFFAKVDVSESDGLVEYRRFENPVQLKKGIMTFYPDKLTWRGVSGRIGPQQIDDSEGSVFWKDDISVEVNKIDARLDAGPFLEEATSFPAIRKGLEPLIHSAAGLLEIKNMKVHGSLKDIKNLEYDFTAATDGLMVDTPLLPDQARIQTSEARIGSNRAVLLPVAVEMSGQRLMLETDLFHTAWKNFSGSLKITGTIEQEMAGWVKEKNWIPGPLFPGAPCLLDPLMVSFNKNKLNITGKIVSARSTNSITTQLDLIVSENLVDLKNLAVSSGGDNARMWLRLDRGERPGLKAGFAGGLKKEALDIILANNRFLTGELRGNCELEYYFHRAAANRLKGDLKASGCVLPVKNNRIVIDKAAIGGHQSIITINQADLRLNDEYVTIDGRLYFFDDADTMADKADIKTDLNLKSDYVSAKNIQRLFYGLKGVFADSDFFENPLPQSGDPAFLAGNINFDIKEFQYNPDKEIFALAVKEFTGHDLSGAIILRQPGDMISVFILSGNVCGSNVTGIISVPPETTALTFHTGAGTESDALELLSCLGIEGARISGGYSLDAAIRGTLGNWTGGHVKFRSEKGRMHGLTIISKILTILNVTELLSLNTLKSFFTTGYPYSEMQVSGKIKDNMMTVDETKIIGEGLDIFINGTVDLDTTDLDLAANVKPFKTIDSIITLIPYVGKTLGEGEKSIAFIPFKIKGNLKEPDVFLISGPQAGEKPR